MPMKMMVTAAMTRNLVTRVAEHSSSSKSTYSTQHSPLEKSITDTSSLFGHAIGGITTLRFEAIM
jgi:hypothetical protein